VLRYYLWQNAENGLTDPLKKKEIFPTSTDCTAPFTLDIHTDNAADGADTANTPASRGYYYYTIAAPAGKGYYHYTIAAPAGKGYFHYIYNSRTCWQRLFSLYNSSTC
jgi:hypothetical protein